LVFRTDLPLAVLMIINLKDIKSRKKNQILFFGQNKIELRLWKKQKSNESTLFLMIGRNCYLSVWANSAIRLAGWVLKRPDFNESQAWADFEPSSRVLETIQITRSIAPDPRQKSK